MWLAYAATRAGASQLFPKEETHRAVGQLAACLGLPVPELALVELDAVLLDEVLGGVPDELLRGAVGGGRWRLAALCYGESAS